MLVISLDKFVSGVYCTSTVLRFGQWSLIPSAPAEELLTIPQDTVRVACLVVNGRILTM